MKTYILSCQCNIPEYIINQYKSIQKYFKTEFEYVVFNDGKNKGDRSNFFQDDRRRKIIDVCEEYDIKCVNIPEDYHRDRTILFPNTIEKDSESPSCRATIAYQYALNMYNNICKNENAYLFIIDADMFFINDFNIDIFMNNYNLAGISQGIGYLWTGITIFKPNELKLENYYCDCGVINNQPVDAGGHSYFFLQNEQYKFKSITCAHFTYPETFYEANNNDIEKLLTLYSQLREDKSANKEIILNSTILHIRSGSNWDYRSKEFKYKELEIIKNYLMSKN